MRRLTIPLCRMAIVLCWLTPVRAAEPDPRPTTPPSLPAAPPATGPAATPATPAPGPATPATTPSTPAAAAPKAGPSAQVERVQSIPEIGQCKREPLNGASALDELAAEKKKRPGQPNAEEREEFERVAARFSEVALEYNREVESLLDDSFKDRMKGVAERFDRESGQIEISESERRNDAIAQFERFIEKYPREARYTPDAMFRLAELYYEKSAVDYDVALKFYNQQKALYDRGKVPERPKNADRDYSDVIRTYQRLLATFGDSYRYADAVHYLLGYVLQESEDDIAARKAWMDLVEKHPKSEYAPEVWLRIGENHFDYGEFEQAADAYKKALVYTESRFYDKALYKLAWTYFQIYDYDAAIRSFKELISFYDKGGKLDGATASALRDEAIDYLAKSLAEDDWDNDGEDDANRGIARALAYLDGGQNFERDIIVRYASALYDLHDIRKYAESIEVYRKLIAMNPTALDAVDFQQRIIQIYDVLRDVENSTRERQRLAEMFAPGGAWSRANAKEAKRIAEATEAIEVEMRRRALGLHQRAQELKAEALNDEKPELLPQAEDHYRQAARAYQEYLSRYPAQPSTYEMRFYLAETLYYSLQFKDAARTYLEVAAEPYLAKFREPAAWSSVKSFERILADQVAAGKLPEKANPSAPWQPDKDEGESSGELKTFKAEAYPQELRDWLAAVDFYVLRDIQREGSNKPQIAFAYQAASVAARFRAYEDARARFRQVIACFPDDELAADAMANILNTYRDENDLQNLEKWANIAEKIQLGDPEITAEIQKKIKVFKLGAQFQRAEQLLADKQHLEAAKEFERLADQNQDALFLDKAYYNAAMAYKEVKYYDSAARIFEKLVNEPRFAKSEFKTESVFELAENYKLFFAFEKATETYFAFLQRTEGTKNANRPYALFTAARLQEYAGNLKAAAGTYERYANVFKDREDSANAIFRAAELNERLSDRENQKRLLQTFIERFSEASGMSVRVLGAMLQLGDIAKAQNKVRDANKYYGDVVREYTARGFQPGTPAANYAAKARFELVERTFDEYAKIRLTGASQRKMGADLARKKKILEELELSYGEILPYKSLDWTIAAFYRLGDLYRDFADTLYKAPEPQGLSDEELEAYVNIIEDEGLKYENVAIERFERTVVESRRLKVTTEWAEKALEAVNKYKPADYPLYKEPKRAFTFTPRYRIDARATRSVGPKPDTAPPGPTPGPTTTPTAPPAPVGTPPDAPAEDLK